MEKIAGAGRVLSRESMVRVVVLLVISLTMIRHAYSEEQAKGRITGKIVGAQTGEIIIGASVLVDQTKLGAATNLDGTYIINHVPAGTYKLIVMSIGFTKVSVDSVVVSPGGVTKIDLSLQAVALTGEEVTVEAKRLYDNESSMLKVRQMAPAVSDAISSQGITKSGASDAAAAMSRVTGASVVGGKYVLIRGLGGRYANTTLNGAVLPAADQEKQSVQLDIVPTNLLENIVVQKTATPDRSGDFSGGSVNLNTKSIPDDLTLSFSSSSSYNTMTTFRNDMLTFPGGSNEWLGTDASSHSRPAILDQAGSSLPYAANIGSRDTASARLLDAATKAMDNRFDFNRMRAPLNQSYALSFGNRYSLWDRSLGVLASLSYNRNSNFYDDGNRTRWGGGSANTLVYEYSLRDVKATEDVLIGGLASVAYQLSPSSKVTLMYNRNQSGQKMSRFMYGAFPRDFPEGATWETRVLQYTQRSMDALQANGEHLLNLHKLYLPSNEKDLMKNPSLP